MKRLPKIAIIHDYLRSFGGGEQVLLKLIDIWPHATIFTATSNISGLGIFRATFEKLPIKTAWVQHVPLFNQKPLLYRLFLPLIWSSIDVGDADIIISSSGSNIAKAIKIPQGAIHICYCHTPPRFLYNLKTETDFFQKTLIRWLIQPFLFYLKTFDQKTSRNVDFFIANSETVKKRIRKIYKRNATVIYPPVRLAKEPKSFKSGNYYLVVSRLVRYKNIDLIIEAFNNMEKSLIIVGTGSQERKLKKLAGNNIKFLGQINMSTLVTVLKNCIALVIAAEDEDFGITAVEAMSYGKPVIAYNSGGLKETVIPGKTGIFFRTMNKNALIKVIKKFEKTNFDPKICVRHAENFSEAIFKKKIKAFVTKVFQNQKL